MATAEHIARLREEIARRRGASAVKLHDAIEEELQQELQREAELEAEYQESERRYQARLRARKAEWLAVGGTVAGWEEQLQQERLDYLQALALQHARQTALRWGQRRRREAAEEREREARLEAFNQLNPIQKSLHGVNAAEYLFLGWFIGIPVAMGLIALLVAR